MADKIAELKLDVAELNKLSKLCERTRVRDVISLETRRLETEISRLTELQQANQPANAPVENKSSLVSKNTCYDVKITNYAWDQSDKLVKIFVTLEKVQNLPEDSINSTFTDRSFELVVKGIENKNYVLTIKNLLEEINPNESKWKVKTNSVVLWLAKKEAGKTWSHLTSVEKKANEAKAPPKFKDNEDVSTGIMDVMREMYQNGDDEMKRTIMKSWAESSGRGGGF
ncbi:calcyclin-binding protein [Nilaparvata lugens]|uniref:calcyclin-binding protein n=1 Tax=Nilaparvata lugens TaxID=108931 RepID=UPI000B9940DD|nr:calcyclin-binding protein [Nilaparvata lugens]